MKNFFLDNSSKQFVNEARDLRQTLLNYYLKNGGYGSQVVKTLDDRIKPIDAEVRKQLGYGSDYVLQVVQMEVNRSKKHTGKMYLAYDHGGKTYIVKVLLNEDLSVYKVYADAKFDYSLDSAMIYQK